MKKAIVLTYAPVNKTDAKLLKETNIFKIATNFSAVDLNPDVRLTADDIVDKCLECDSCPVVSLNYDLDKDRVINGHRLPKRHTSLISCIDYLLFKGYTHILLVASNPESATHNLNNEGISQLKDYLYLYKYTKEGCLDIPHKTIKEFLMMTDEEKILGMKEKPKAKIDPLTFSDACMYEVSTVGKNNKSVENGALINIILPVEQKQKLLNGEFEITYNGMVIKRLTGSVTEPKEEVLPEPEPVAVKKTVKKAVKKKASKK